MLSLQPNRIEYEPITQGKFMAENHTIISLSPLPQRFRCAFSFAFSFITKVVDERCKYYAYYDIELLRRQLMHSRCPVVKSDIKKSHGKLLFRIVNYFKPQKLIQVGASAGIGTLYMTACSSQLDYTVLGRSDESLKWTLWGLKKFILKRKQAGWWLVIINRI